MTVSFAVGAALHSLRLHKLRSALNILGVMIGVAAVIASVGIGVGAQHQVDEQIKALGTDLIMIWPGHITTGGVRMGTGTRTSLTDDDAAALQAELWQVEAAAPALQGRGQLIFGDRNWQTGYYGVTPEYFDVRGWSVESGRAFDAADVSAAAKVVLLGETVARHLFDGADPVGQVIRVGRVPMTVIGVLARKGQNHWGMDQDDTILMPLTTLRNRVVGGSRAKLRMLNSISVKVRPGVPMADARAEIRLLLRERHFIQPHQPDDFTLRDLTEVISAREESAWAMTMLLAAVGAVSLMVGGVGIMNMMLASVAERTREIGIRMAVGARRRDILSQFLLEAVIIALIGGISGIALAFGATLLLEHFTGLHSYIGSHSLVVAFGVSTAVGISFGVLPAYKASRLTPVAALRLE